MNITSLMPSNASECVVSKVLLAQLPPLVGILFDVVYRQSMHHKSMKMWDECLAKVQATHRAWKFMNTLHIQMPKFTCTIFLP